MKKLLSAIFFFLVLTAFGADPSLAESANKEFGTAWQERYKTYLAQRAEVDGRAKAAAAIAVQSRASGSDASAQTAMDAAWDAANEAAKLSARGQLLYEFLELFKTKPSPELLQMWMQGKGAGLQAKKKETAALDAQLRATKPRTVVEQDRWLGEVERLFMLRGTVAGMAEEMDLLDLNLGAYSAAIRREQADDERQRARWAAFGAALTQQSQQRRGWSTRCTTTATAVGTATNCDSD